MGFVGPEDGASEDPYSGLITFRVRNRGVQRAHVYKRVQAPVIYNCCEAAIPCL